jgi:hypothetical protein
MPTCSSDRAPTLGSRCTCKRGPLAHNRGGIACRGTLRKVIVLLRPDGPDAGYPLLQPSLTGVDMRIPAQRHANVEKTGALWRQSTLLKVWKKSYVVITKESLMFWYASERDSAPEDVLALKKVNGVRREESSIRPHAFVISGKVSRPPARRVFPACACAAVPCACVRLGVLAACQGIGLRLGLSVRVARGRARGAVFTCHARLETFFAFVCALCVCKHTVLTHSRVRTNEKGVVFAFAAEGEQEMESWLRAIGKGLVNASTTEWDETSDRLEARE